MRRLLLLACLALTSAPAGAQSLSANLEEARLLSRVKVALAEDPAVRAFSFEPRIEAGVLTIRGTVETEAEQRRVAEVAGAVDGVERVENRVRVRGGARDAASELPRVERTEPEPSEEAEEPVPAEEYHTVRRGDTLGAIARRYGVSVRQIQQLNGLRGSGIRAGQRLRVK